MDVVKLLEDKALAAMNVIKEANSRGDSEVQKFYDGAVVFLTGGSGFLGKQLIEKLVRSTNIKKIYVLLRPRKGKSIQDRLKKILEDPLYEDLHKEKPSFVDKIIVIQGDTAEINLGLDEKTWSTLTDEINIIFHGAATINFVEKLKIATLTNIRGTREMLKLARACKHIKSIVHVSTAYSHATKSRSGQEVKEDFYESPIPPDALIELGESLDEDILNNMITPLMHDWPNTYTFTKAVAEELVRKQAADLPICIVRPAIVISAYVEPLLGWVHPLNAFGPSGIIVGSGLGILHTLQLCVDKNIDFIPVDYVNNATIVAAWKTFQRHQEDEKETIIYTISSNRNPAITGDIKKCLDNIDDRFKTKQAVWYIFVIATQYRFMYQIWKWLLHFIPALVIDGCCMLIGKKPRLFEIYKKVDNLSSVFAYFSNNDWGFQDGNTLKLYNGLSKTDKQLYTFDISFINNKEMIWSWCYGAKKYILKEDMDGTENVAKKQFWFSIAHYIIFPLYIYSLYKLVYLVFVSIYNVLGLFAF